MAQTIKAVKDDGYKLFSRFTEDRQKAFQEAIDYIEMLSQSTGIRCDDWDLIKVFGTGDGNEIVVQSRDINKRFFAEFERMKTAVPFEARLIDPLIMKNIEKISDEFLKRQRAAHETRLADYIRNADSHAREMNKAVALAAEERLKIQAITRGNDIEAFSKQLDRIQTQGFWQFLDFKDNRFIRFVTREPVILTKKNPAANIDISVNMGKYKGIYDLHQPRLYIDTHENNLTVAGRIHVWGGGNDILCYGNAQDKVNRACASFDICNAYEILQALITNGHDGNPHVPIEEFAAHRAALDKAAAEKAAALERVGDAPVPEPQAQVAEAQF